jgi:hypothetical protein
MTDDEQPNDAGDEGDTATEPPKDNGSSPRTHPREDGYASAGAAVPQPETGPNAKLPDDVRRAPAVAYPSVKATEFHVDPAPSSAEGQTRLLYAQVTALREELLHGERSRLGVARNVRVLDRRIQQLLEELAALGDADGGDTGRVRSLLYEVDELRHHRQEIQDASEPFVEAIDKFHIHSLLGDGTDESVLEDLLAAEDPPESVRRAVRRTLRDHHQEVISGSAESDIYDNMAAIADIYADLEDLYERSDWRVAEAAATAATDVPFLLEDVVDPARELGFDVGSTETVATDALADVLADRFDVATNVALEATADYGDDAAVTDLAEPIRAAIAARTDRPSPSRTPADLALPLLDVPARDNASGPPGVGESDASALNHVETPTGYLLTGAFRTVGDFGGVLYLTPDGEWQWALNPWVADERVDIDIAGIDTYGRLWCHAVVAWGMAYQLTSRGTRSEQIPREVDCPLCAHSPSSACGTDGCAFRDLRSGIAAAIERLDG